MTSKSEMKRLAIQKGGKSPRTKGFDFEREVVRIAKAAGIDAVRSVASVYPDVKLNNRPVSCKRRKTGLEMFYKELESPEPHDFVLFRADRKPILKISYWKP